VIRAEKKLALGCDLFPGKGSEATKFEPKNYNISFYIFSCLEIQKVSHGWSTSEILFLRLHICGKNDRSNKLNGCSSTGDSGGETF
jgi:hypothetical protein